jgi:hypothetical protein
MYREDWSLTGGAIKVLRRQNVVNVIEQGRPILNSKVVLYSVHVHHTTMCGYFLKSVESGGCNDVCIEKIGP